MKFRRSVVMVGALAVVVATSTANAQRGGTAEIVPPESTTAASVEELVHGLGGGDCEIADRRDDDLDGDNRPEVLLRLNGCDQQGLIARRVGDRWTAYVTQSGGSDEVSVNRWGPGVTAYGVRHAILITDLHDRDDGQDQEFSNYRVFAFREGVLYQVFDDTTRQDSRRIEPAVDGLAYVQCGSGQPTRYCLIRWNPTTRRTTVSRWSRRHP